LRVEKTVSALPPLSRATELEYTHLDFLHPFTNSSTTKFLLILSSFASLEHCGHFLISLKWFLKHNESKVCEQVVRMTGAVNSS
jgi:hypothetical protein